VKAKMDHIFSCGNRNTTMVSEQEKTSASLPVVSIETIVCLRSLIVFEKEDQFRIEAKGSDKYHRPYYRIKVSNEDPALDYLVL
jgi:hypothetical protein